MVLEADDFELLGYGVMLGLLLAYVVLKLAQDVRGLLQAMQDVKSVVRWIKSLCCGSRATPAPVVNKGDLDSDVEFPAMPTRMHHVKARPKAIHFHRECSHFHESSEVVTIPVCVTCLRKKREQLRSSEKEQ